MPYTYDGAGTNFKGRLRSVSSTDSTTNVTQFDALGRVLAGNWVTPTSGGQTYPSGRVITTGYDPAGRINGLTGQKSGESNKTYTSSYSYTAHGGVSSMQLGNLWEHTNFNKLLQPTQIGLGTSSNDSSKLRLDYGFGTTSNNGNMMSQSTVIGGTTYGQSYTYDALNRLATALEGSKGKINLFKMLRFIRDPFFVIRLFCQNTNRYQSFLHKFQIILRLFFCNRFSPAVKI